VGSARSSVVELREVSGAGVEEGNVSPMH